MDDRGQDLDAIDHSRAGADYGVGVDRPDLGRRRQHVAFDDLGGERRGSFEAKAARRHDNDARVRFADRRPLHALRVPSRPAEHTLAACRCDHVGDPVTGGEGRVGPLEHEHRTPPSSGHRLGDAIEPAPEVRDDRAGAVGSIGRTADALDRRQHLFQRHRVERQHVGTARQIRQGVVDLADVDGTHRTEILGDDEVGVEVGERTSVEAVEVLAGSDPFPDDGVDLGRRQALGERRGRHDPAGAGLGREVALERDAHDVVPDA